MPLTFEMLNSEAWKSLSTNAVWVYIAIMQEYNRRKYDSKNKKSEHELPLTHKKVDYKMSEKTFYNARKELVEYGFFEVVREGGLHRCSSLFRVSNRWILVSEELKQEKARAFQSQRDKARNESAVDEPSADDILDSLVA